MKKIISIFSLVLAIGLYSANAQCCSTAKAAACKTAGTDCKMSKTAQVKSDCSTSVKAYYFHATRRCATCQAVESVSKDALKEYYGDKVAWTSINRDEDKDNPMIKKYKVSGQTLLIIKGDEVVNLTNDAFMNARTKPDKLKAKIKQTVDSMI